jgi:uncharacterized protein
MLGIPLSISSIGGPLFTSAILKIAGRCNINCTYCYMYNLADQSWREQPVHMPEKVLAAFFYRLERYLKSTGLNEFHITLHGGEPLMAGKLFFSQFSMYRTSVESNTGARISVSVQTNGLLMDDYWVDLFNKNRIRVGVSLDGPRKYHDEFRLTKSGVGTHQRTEEIVRKLVEIPEWTSCFSGVLCVLNPRASGSELVRYFYDRGIHRINFLLPDQNYDHPVHLPEELASLGTILTSAYVEWRSIDDPSFKIVLFEELVRFFLNGEVPTMDMLAGNPISIMTVESSGAIEPLDVFKCCGRDYTQTKFSIFHSDILDIADTTPFNIQMNPRSNLPRKCRTCEFEAVCGGGYMPHRLADGAFHRESFFCDQLLRLYSLVARDIQRYTKERLALD